MVEVFNFDNCDVIPKFYGGRSCSKICIDVGGMRFLLKMPGKVKVIGDEEGVGYANTPVSEYLGSLIFRLFGINSHETILGYRNGKLSVGCLDFLEEGDELIEFSKIMVADENVYFESGGSVVYGDSMDLDVILETIRSNKILRGNPNIEDFFWKMFIIDALIGNMDRTNEDWGIIFNRKTGIRLAPVYDNDACLNSDWSVDSMFRCMERDDLLAIEAYKGKTCKYTLDGKAINPYDIILGGRYDGCNKALAELYPKIDLKAILFFMNEVPRKSDIQVEFYKKLLEKRYDIVFKPAYESIISVYNKK